MVLVGAWRRAAAGAWLMVVDSSERRAARMRGLGGRRGGAAVSGWGSVVPGLPDGRIIWNSAVTLSAR